MAEKQPTEPSAEIRELITGLMDNLNAFGGMLEMAREKCRDEYRSVETEPRNRVRIYVDGLMATLAAGIRTPIANVNEVSSYQISLSASFIRTHFVVFDLIMNGDVVEAVVLVRKQLESLARLNELDSKPLAKLHGRTPNIQNALKGGAGRIYGDLSEIAHFATPRVSEFLNVVERGPATGPNLLNTYSERAAACMDMFHFITLYFLMWLVEKQSDWYPGRDVKDLHTLLGLTIATALEAGVIKPSPDAPPDAGL